MMEPGGRGGVYQHTLAIADLLAGDGRRVVVHSATDAEFAPTSARLCRCVSWERNMGGGRWRATRIATRYLLKTVPHLARGVGRHDVLHLQGRFKPGFFLLQAGIARARGTRVILSPHNMFARDGTRVARLALRADLRSAHAVIVFSAEDVHRARSLGAPATQSTLVMHMETLNPELVTDWRVRWRTSTNEKVVLFAGQLRRDKRLDRVIEAVALLSHEGWRLAVVGEDKGDATAMRDLALARSLNVSWHVGYWSADEFIAAIAAADIVCCPYEIASQSAILAMARVAGTTSVATATGGLAELADYTVVGDEPESLARCIAAALPRPRQSEEAWYNVALAAHLQAYGA